MFYVLCSLAGPVPQPYLSYRLARLHKLAESILGLLKSLQIQALEFQIYGGEQNAFGETSRP
jgi:hypothetical protein